jgi:hypothetical protein
VWNVELSSESVILEDDLGENKAFTSSIPKSFKFRHPKQVIALVVILDGELLGQVKETVVEFQNYGPTGAIPYETGEINR